MATADREKRARKAARLWASGLSKRAVARKLGVHHQTVNGDLAWLDRDSWTDPYMTRLKKRRVPARDRRMATAVKLRHAGLSLRAVAAELGVSYQTVANDLARWARDYGNVVIPLSKRGVSKLPPRGQDRTPEFDKMRRDKVPPRGQDAAPEIDTKDGS
jgi:transposase